MRTKSRFHPIAVDVEDRKSCVVLAPSAEPALRRSARLGREEAQPSRPHRFVQAVSRARSMFVRRYRAIPALCAASRHPETPEAAPKGPAVPSFFSQVPEYGTQLGFRVHPPMFDN